jgi:inner membrane protein
MNENNNKPASFIERNGTSFKAFFILFLLGLFFIPKSMMESLIQERMNYKEQVIGEVSSKWGEAQTVSGPIVSVPYLEFYRDSPNEEFRKIIKFAHFLPKELKINGELFPEKRSRSIYEIVVYNSKIQLEGFFDPFDVIALGIPKENILWNYASCGIGIDDLRGIEEQVLMDWGTQKINFNPGLETNEVLMNGISAKIPIGVFVKGTTERYNFKVNIELKGSKLLYFTPIGTTTTVDIKSSWATPRFDGAFLPDTREVTDTGFTANWKILNLNRNIPQNWLGNSNVYINGSAFGINLMLPMNNYIQSDRSIKYAMLLISLTFALYFFIEMLNKRRIHAFHYILVGFALCLYYSLLVSISEHFRFSIAYFVASVMTVGLITWYSYSILKDRRLALGIAAVLSLLYSFMYSIIRLEDYALLAGSIGLFVALTIVMHFARKVDWYD